MPPFNNAVLLLAVSLCLAACSSPRCTLAAAAKGGKPKPLVTAIAKDAATKLYAAPLKGGRPLVLDLSGQTISFTCDRKRPTPPTLTTILSANATDGRNPLHPVSFPAVASCAPPPRSLLGGKLALPAGAAGVAGLAMGSSAALPAQVSRAQRLPDKFMLCLPRSGAGDGVAIFGGGPLFLTTITGYAYADDFTSGLTYTPLLSKGGSSSYYLPMEAIAVNGARVKLPGGALAPANGGVVLSTTAPYTALRPDVYRPFVDAFDKALKKQSNSKRVAAVAPFELCYDSSTLNGPTRIGWLVPSIDLMLEGGKNWTFFAGLHTMVDVNSFTAACFAFVEMKPKKDGGGYSGAPAVEIGGFQMENTVLQFDLEKKRLGFNMLQIFTSCSNFNFTLSH